jgi:hypothetical protein
MKKNTRQKNTRKKNTGDETTKAKSTSNVRPEDLIVPSPNEDPVDRAYARTGRADTSGINGIPANDEDAGEERRKLYERGAKLVSRID